MEIKRIKSIFYNNGLEQEWKQLEELAMIIADDWTCTIKELLQVNPISRRILKKGEVE